MIKNSPEKFERDLRLFRWLMSVLTIGQVWISIDYFGRDQCHVIPGRGGALVSDLCALLGPNLTGVALLVGATCLMTISFSNATKERLRDHYSNY